MRTADGIKIALSYTYIKCDIVPALDISTLEGSFYQYIQDDLGILPKVSNYAVNATLPTVEQKKLLEINDTALLKIVHPSFLESGEIFEYTETYYVGDRYTYYLYSNTP
ncbi:UTRA domain-containing protein [Geosporobacter ferrireducens]|uniref:UTRA domain-containing protein n=1 Tax=Geosporobacter ferrireducens TaxID=1424294 RepID=UPI002150251F|nr:UTRA domain-containing protein [Geosporobacter ferrireducens]